MEVLQKGTKVIQILYASKAKQYGLSSWWPIKRAIASSPAHLCPLLRPGRPQSLGSVFYSGCGLFLMESVITKGRRSGPDAKSPTTRWRWWRWVSCACYPPIVVPTNPAFKLGYQGPCMSPDAPPIRLTPDNLSAPFTHFPSPSFSLPDVGNKWRTPLRTNLRILFQFGSMWFVICCLRLWGHLCGTWRWGMDAPLTALSLMGSLIAFAGGHHLFVPVAASISRFASRNNPDRPLPNPSPHTHWAPLLLWPLYLDPTLNRKSTSALPEVGLRAEWALPLEYCFLGRARGACTLPGQAAISDVHFVCLGADPSLGLRAGSMLAND